MRRVYARTAKCAGGGAKQMGWMRVKCASGPGVGPRKGGRGVSKEAVKAVGGQVRRLQNRWWAVGGEQTRVVLDCSLGFELALVLRDTVGGVCMAGVSVLGGHTDKDAGRWT